MEQKEHRAEQVEETQQSWLQDKTGWAVQRSRKKLFYSVIGTSPESVEKQRAQRVETLKWPILLFKKTRFPPQEGEPLEVQK